MIGRLCVVERRKKGIKLFNGCVIRIKRVIVCSTRKHENFFLVQNICASRVQPLRIEDSDFFCALLNLGDNGVVCRVNIRKEFVQRLVNKDLHHSRITVIAKHSTMLPHRVSLRLFARSCVIYCMECWECYPATKGVAANNDV